MSRWYIQRFFVRNAKIAKEIFARYYGVIREQSECAVELSHEGNSLKLGSADPEELARYANWLKSCLA